MAVVLEQKSLARYLEDFQNRIASKTNINLFERDSKAKAIADVFAEQLYNDRQDIIAGFNALQLSQARGAALDQIGLGRGVTRLRESFASVNSSESSLSFYVNSGVFGDINGGSGFTIPKGTKVWSTVKENDLGKVIQYSLTADVICNATDSIVYASAKADASGADFNVGASVLRNHGFTNYSSGSGLLVINLYAILNGRSEESDEQYRFRISQQYASIATGNETRARLVALNVPGVIDTKIIPGYYGAGSIGLVVLGSEFQTTTKMVEAVQRNVDAMSLPGVNIKALAAVNALFDLEVTVHALKTLTAAEQARVKNTLRQLSVNYLRSKGLGGTVSLSDLGIIYSQNTGMPVQFKKSTTGIFDRVYVRRGTVSSNASERVTVVSTSYSLDLDEFADIGNLTINYE